MNQSINIDGELINKYNENIPKIKEYFNIELVEINKSTKLNELIILKGNKIYEFYESLNSTIEEFNKLLDTYKPDKEIQIEQKTIQDISNDFFIKSKNFNNSAFDRLLSKRNRFENDDLNIYNGDRIIYDFKTIEKMLINEFIFGKKLLINSQRVFIFSNEVFSNERNNLISQIINSLKINKENNGELIIRQELLNLKKELDEIYENEDLKVLYYNMQYILLFRF